MPDAKWYSTHVFHTSSPRFRRPLLLRRQNIHEFNALFAFDWTKPGAPFKWPAELVHWSVTLTKLISCNEGHPLLLYREAKRDMESIFGNCAPWPLNTDHRFHRVNSLSGWFVLTCVVDIWYRERKRESETIGKRLSWTALSSVFTI